MSIALQSIPELSSRQPESLGVKPSQTSFDKQSMRPESKMEQNHGLKKTSISIT